eukprot:CAMPEP_0197023916 /NCGR_PEP_ID=MMETSP1384-20130603/4559_1 /TAXON_ID=29189 /ORGANISM="Ammonia sp." /LENGTH=341 /DNA_ID=CAMNT_0042452215 /DNA_START=54 /DNA_END=1079 /DNA_ORIENTATION=+
MQLANLLAVLFVVIMMIMAGVYSTRRNPERGGAIAGIKRLHESDSDDVTESEPELEMKEREIDKMEQIPEENQDPSDEANINPEISDVEKIKERMRKKLKKKRRREQGQDDDSASSDSDDYSMQRMVEEYQRSRTLVKKFSEVIEDISDTFKRKSIELRRRFEPASPPAVVKPMSFAERQAMLNQSSKHKKQLPDDANNGNDNALVNVDAFDVNFDDEKQAEKMEEHRHLIGNQDEDDELEQEEEEIGGAKKGDAAEVVHNEEDSDFGDFDAQNFTEFDAEQFDRSNGAIEIVVNEQGKESKEKIEAERGVDGSEAVEIQIDDEKVNERQQLVDSDNRVES